MIKISQFDKTQCYLSTSAILEMGFEDQKPKLFDCHHFLTNISKNLLVEFIAKDHNEPEIQDQVFFIDEWLSSYKSIDQQALSLNALVKALLCLDKPKVFLCFGSERTQIPSELERISFSLEKLLIQDKHVFLKKNIEEFLENSTKSVALKALKKKSPLIYQERKGRFSYFNFSSSHQEQLKNFYNQLQNYSFSFLGHSLHFPKCFGFSGFVAAKEDLKGRYQCSKLQLTSIKLSLSEDEFDQESSNLKKFVVEQFFQDKNLSQYRFIISSPTLGVALFFYEAFKNVFPRTVIWSLLYGDGPLFSFVDSLVFNDRPIIMLDCHDLFEASLLILEKETYDF